MGKTGTENRVFWGTESRKCFVFNDWSGYCVYGMVEDMKMKTNTYRNDAKATCTGKRYSDAWTRGWNDRTKGNDINPMHATTYRCAWEDGYRSNPGRPVSPEDLRSLRFQRLGTPGR